MGTYADPMKLTKKWLEEKTACDSGVEWFKAQKQTDSIKVLDALIADDKLDWANWLIVRMMTRPQCLVYAIYAAEQVLDIFENKYPKDDRPRKAIEAAKEVLKHDTPAARAAAGAAGEAAWSAAWSAARAAVLQEMRLRIVRYGMGLLK